MRLLVLEDDRGFIEDVRDTFLAHQFECEVALNVRTAQRILEQRRMDLALIDASAPTVDAKAVVEHLKSRYPKMKLVLFNGSEKKPEQRKMRKLGADSYLGRGSDLKSLERVVLRNLDGAV